MQATKVVDGNYCQVMLMPSSELFYTISLCIVQKEHFTRPFIQCYYPAKEQNIRVRVGNKQLDATIHCRNQ